MAGSYMKYHVQGKMLPSGDYVLNAMDIKRLNDTLDNIFLKLGGNIDIVDFTDKANIGNKINISTNIENNSESVQVAFNGITGDVANDADGTFRILNGKLEVKNGSNVVVIDGQYNIHKIVASGTLTLTAALNELTKTANISHALGYMPRFMCFVNDGGYAYNMPYTKLLEDGSMFHVYHVDAFSSANDIVFKLNRSTTDAGSGSRSVEISYIIFKEVAF